MAKRESLERIGTLADLRCEIETGIRELDAGLGRELDVEDTIRQARQEHDECMRHLGQK